MKHAPWSVLPIVAIVAGCTSNPDQSVYIMPPATSVDAGLQATSAGLALTLRPIVLPDYLDTTDLLTRTGQYKVEASRTGRWGERLSEGVTRALAADLGSRMPAYVVTSGPATAPTVRIDVVVSTFDVTAATSMLVATWIVAWRGDSRQSVTRHGTFRRGIAQPGGDLEVVTAMAETVAELAESIAATTRADATNNSRFGLRK